jgi:GH15 family glucan-1,4-alpha-glucosidase
MASSTRFICRSLVGHRSAISALSSDGAGRWEENGGASPFTFAVEVAALVGVADFCTCEEERSYCLSIADYWNERIEDWTYSEKGPLAREHWSLRNKQCNAADAGWIHFLWRLRQYTAILDKSGNWQVCCDFGAVV